MIDYDDEKMLFLSLYLITDDENDGF